VAENGPIEADRSLLNVAFEIVRESSVRKLASKDFVLAEEDKEYSGADPGDK
jgi:hypothetical protein